MKNYSTEYAAQLAVLVGFILKLFKIEIAGDELTTVISALLVVGGSAYTLYQRYARGQEGTQSEVTVLGVRK